MLCPWLFVTGVPLFHQNVWHAIGVLFCVEVLHFPSIFPEVMVVNLSYFCTAMGVPLFRAFDGGIFVKKGHADHLKWGCGCQLSKKSGKKDADGKNMIYNAVDIGLW